jgi:hypothetical protein
VAVSIKGFSRPPDRELATIERLDNLIRRPVQAVSGAWVPYLR